MKRVFVGDSNTHGEFIEPPGYYTGSQQNVRKQTMDLLGEPMSNHVDFGVNSETAYNIAGLYGGSGTMYSNFPGVVDSNATLIMLIGINDLGALKTGLQTWTATKAIGQYAQSLGCTQIIVGTYPTTDRFNSAQLAELASFNTYIRNEAPALGFLVADCGASPMDTYVEFNTTTMTGYWADNIHWSISGCGIVAQRVYQQITAGTDSSTKTEYVIQQADIWDTYRTMAQGQPSVDCQSRIKFTTTAGNIDVRFFRHRNVPSDIGIEVNGVVFPIIAADTSLPDYEQTNTNINIGTPGVLKTVQLTNGAQTGAYGGTPSSSWVMAVSYPNNQSFTIIPSSPVAGRLYLLGDSIATGSNATYREAYGVVPILRRVYNIPVFNDSWGWKAFTYVLTNPGDTSTIIQSKLDAFVNKVVAVNPAKMWIEMGSNDFGIDNGLLTLSEFISLYTTLIDAVHSALPSLHIFCQTIFERNDIANSNAKGWTKTQCRQAVVDICAARPGWTTLIQGPDLVPASYLDVDDLHLNTAGQALFANKINEVLTGTVTYFANAGTDKTITQPSNSVTLNGSVTGSTASWTQLVGPNTANIVSPTSAITQINGLIAGFYQFRLTTNGGAYDDVNVTVNAEIPVEPEHIYVYNWVLGSPAPAGNSYSHPAYGDEFLSFVDWDTLTATGDPSIDTPALQAAFNNIGTTGYSNFLKLIGNFSVNALITKTGGDSYCIMGESPLTTSITWAGASSGTMFYFNGIKYSRPIGRIRLNGANTCRVLIEQQWDNQTANGKGFDTDDEYNDVYFENAEVAIAGGWSGYGFADIDFMRCKFTNLTNTGLTVGNFNALDIRFFDCDFNDCHYCVSNEGGSGNFEMYNCKVINCDTAIRISAVQNFSFVNNYFKDCGVICYASGSANGCQVIFKDNAFLDCTSIPFTWNNQGALILINNKFRNIDGVTTGVYFGPGEGEIIDINNTYSDNIYIPVELGTSIYLRLRQSGRNIVPKESIVVQEPVLLPLQPELGRNIFIVEPGASQATVQALVDTVDAAHRYDRPVIYLKNGSYYWITPVVFPAGCDIQVHGSNSQIYTSGAAQPAFRLIGPTKVTISDVHIMGGGVGSGVEITNSDSANAQAHLHNCEFQFIQGIALDLGTYNNIKVNAINTGFPYGNGIGIRQQGSSTVVVCGGQGAVEGSSQFQLSNGAKTIIHGYWLENAPAGIYRVLANGSNFNLSISQMRANVSYSASTAFVGSNGANTKILVLGCHFDSNVKVTGDGTNSKVLVMGSMLGWMGGETPNYFLEGSSSPSAQAYAYLNRKQTDGNSGQGATAMPDQGTPTDAFINEALELFNTLVPPSRITPTADNQTDARFIRLTTSNCIDSVRFVS